MAFGADLGEARSVYRGLRISDLSDVMSGMAVLALRRPHHPTFQHHAVTGFLVSFGRILMTTGASHIGKTLPRMDIRLGLLMAVRASHASRAMDRSFETPLVDIEEKKGTVLFAFTELGIVMAVQAFGIIRGLRS